MSHNPHETDAPVLSLKNDSARQRWELFHRAIAHAKKSNLDAMDDGDVADNDRSNSGQLLSIIR